MNMKTDFERLEELIANAERNLRWMREDIRRNVTNLELHLWSTSASLKMHAGDMEKLAWEIKCCAEENEAIVQEGEDKPDCAPVE